MLTDSGLKTITVCLSTVMLLGVAYHAKAAQSPSPVQTTVDLGGGEYEITQVQNIDLTGPAQSLTQSRIVSCGEWNAHLITGGCKSSNGAVQLIGSMPEFAPHGNPSDFVNGKSSTAAGSQAGWQCDWISSPHIENPISSILDKDQKRPKSATLTAIVVCKK